jgi:hypothetical protein
MARTALIRGVFGTEEVIPTFDVDRVLAAARRREANVKEATLDLSFVEREAGGVFAVKGLRVPRKDGMYHIDRWNRLLFHSSKFPSDDLSDTESHMRLLVDHDVRDAIRADWPLILCLPENPHGHDNTLSLHASWSVYRATRVAFRQLK